MARHAVSVDVRRERQQEKGRPEKVVVERTYVETEEMDLRALDHTLRNVIAQMEHYQNKLAELREYRRKLEELKEGGSN